MKQHNIPYRINPLGVRYTREARYSAMQTEAYERHALRNDTAAELREWGFKDGKSGSTPMDMSHHSAVARKVYQQAYDQGVAYQALRNKAVNTVT